MDVLSFVSKHIAADSALVGHTLEASSARGSDGFADCLWLISTHFLIWLRNRAKQINLSRNDALPLALSVLIVVLMGRSETLPTPSPLSSSPSHCHSKDLEISKITLLFEGSALILTNSSPEQENEKLLLM